MSREKFPLPIDYIYLKVLYAKAAQDPKEYAVLAAFEALFIISGCWRGYGKNGSPRPSGGSVDSAAGEGDTSEPTLDLGFAARKLGQISRSLICLTGHTRADPSTPDRCGDPFPRISVVKVGRRNPGRRGESLARAASWLTCRELETKQCWASWPLPTSPLGFAGTSRPSLLSCCLRNGATSSALAVGSIDGEPGHCLRVCTTEGCAWSAGPLCDADAARTDVSAPSDRADVSQDVSQLKDGC